MAKNIKNKQHIYDQYTICSLWVVMAGFIAISFVKEVINQNFLIHLYVDSFVAVVAFFVVVHNLKKQFDLWENKKPVIIEIGAFVCGLIAVILSAKSPFDVSFLILVIGMILSRKIIEKEFHQK